MPLRLMPRHSRACGIVAPHNASPRCWSVCLGTALTCPAAPLLKATWRYRQCTGVAAGCGSGPAVLHRGGLHRVTYVPVGAVLHCRLPGASSIRRHSWYCGVCCARAMPPNPCGTTLTAETPQVYGVLCTQYRWVPVGAEGWVSDPSISFTGCGMDEDGRCLNAIMVPYCTCLCMQGAQLAARERAAAADAVPGGG